MKLLAFIYFPSSALAWVLHFLLDTTTMWGEVAKAGMTGVLTLVAALLAIWVRDRFSRKAKAEKRGDDFARQLTETSEALAKLSVEERNEIREAYTEYLTRLEDFFKLERDFYADKDRQQQSVIELQKAALESAKTDIERLNFQLRERSVLKDTAK